MDSIRLALAALALIVAPAARPDSVTICYNYGCNNAARVIFSDEDLEPLHKLLGVAQDADDERLVISRVIGRMYAASGRQTPIWRDRGGNYEDDDMDGRMDCIDHSTNTTAFLELLERRGWLRYHIVTEPVWRGLFRSHRAARIEEVGARAQFVVDSWFFDNGSPVAVFDFKRWRRGARANGK